jgi:hypothetical protein
LSVVDSNRFGRRVFRAEATSLDDALAIEEGAERDGADLLITRCPVDRLAVVHALEARQHRLMDTLIHYLGATASGAAPTSQGVREATRDDSEALRCLAEDCFTKYGGHYHADPRLDASLATRGYVEWCLSLLVSQSHRVLVATDEERPVGFLTFSQPPSGGTGDIVLNGVASSHRGRGLYGLLVGQCLRILADAAVPTVQVSTQISNFAPQRTWVRYGLRPFKAVYTFHKWFLS